MLDVKLPFWEKSVPPPQFAEMVDQAWYYRTADGWYLGLLFTTKFQLDRCMIVYQVRGEDKARQEKYPTIQQGMEAMQRAASENRILVKRWE